MSLYSQTKHSILSPSAAKSNLFHSVLIRCRIKRDRSSPEVRPIRIEQGPAPNKLVGVYDDTGVHTWNITLTGDSLSGTGFYANCEQSFALTFNIMLCMAGDDSGKRYCPAPFGLIMTPDPNVIYVS